MELLKLSLTFSLVRMLSISNTDLCFAVGLCKLMEAEQSVSELSEQLVLKEQELAVASQRADTVLQEVTEKARAAEEVKLTVWRC